MPKKPIAPEATPPMMNARVRNRPDWKNERATESSSFKISAEVKNTTMASGTTIMAIVRNWRVMYAMAPSWMATAIFFIAGVPSSALSTPCIRR